LLIFSHISLSFMLLVCSAFEKPPNFAVLPWTPASAVDAPTAKSVELNDKLYKPGMSNEFRLGCQTGMNSVCVEGRGAENFRVIQVVRGAHSTQKAARALRRASKILK
jgi:hypothetical protein